MPYLIPPFTVDAYQDSPVTLDTMPSEVAPVDPEVPKPTVTDFWSLEHKSFPYGKCDIDTSYVTDEGLFHLPIASDTDDTSIFVRAHAPLSQRIVEFRVSRKGHKPHLPSPFTPDTNHVLLRTEITSAGGALCADGLTHEFFVEGRWIYGLVTPKRPGIDNLQTTASPLIITKLGKLEIKAGSFVIGMF